MIELYLITGFLGAGKTTFLKARLACADVRTGVLVNDFGKINFDGLQLRAFGTVPGQLTGPVAGPVIGQAAGPEVIELSNGSIFCSCLKEQFIDGLVHLIRLGLDRIYIESSGLADPSEMDRILDVIRMRTAGVPFRFKGTICLVDGSFFLKTLPKMLSVERQVRHSHLILINKCDLIDEVRRAVIRDKLRELNPRARIVETVYGQTGPSELDFDVFETGNEETTNTIATRNRTLILHVLYDPEEAAFCAFLDAVSTHFYRIKGWVRINGQPVKVDQVNQQISLEAGQHPVDPAAVNQLVCLTAQGIESISHLAIMADRYIPGIFKLDMS